MNKKEMFKAFDMTEIEKHKEKYAEEAREKYGHTDAYKESMKKPGLARFLSEAMHIYCNNLKE